MLKALKFANWSMLIISVMLLAVSLYGLTQSLRPAQFDEEDLRFGAQDIQLSLEEYREAIKRKENESPLAYSERLAKVIAQGTAHIHWTTFEPEEFNQLVPIWENWILFFMGKFSGIPEYERYHFADPHRSIERGIGICGEVSMVMEQLLEREGIPAEIISFKGHVIVAAQPEDKQLLFDPDFGVTLPFSLEELAPNIDAANAIYLNAGYTQKDAEFFANSYTGRYTVWDGAHHFITKKFYFERFAYVAKWVLPLLGIVVFLMVQRLVRSKSKGYVENHSG
uniref:hypothetical protein n=1 Tax=Ningiella ruwaisensis TaxID=2364274 RepID=UPI0010A08558|nr:hypothetical protein [Ningiella ruwaisensis]